MADDDASGENLRGRITRQGEDALGKLAQDLLENPLITGAITRAFGAREPWINWASTLVRPCGACSNPCPSTSAGSPQAEFKPKARCVFFGRLSDARRWLSRK